MESDRAATVARLIITADEGMIQSFLDDKCGMDRYMGRARHGKIRRHSPLARIMRSSARIVPSPL
ncbi:MAG: hypothetical protein ACYDBP_13410 [Leptospirales bacterium]